MSFRKVIRAIQSSENLLQELREGGGRQQTRWHLISAGDGEGAYKEGHARSGQEADLEKVQRRHSEG